MILFASCLLGVLVGVTTARRRKGNWLDMAQYGASFAIAFMILGLFLTLIIDRLAS